MKYFILTMVLLAFAALPASAQDEAKPKVDPADYLEEVETPPQIVGGLSALREHIVYPEAAVKEKIEGTVIVQALIGIDGKDDDETILKSNSDLLSDAALKAVGMVDFTPGKVDGKAVKTKVAVPVKFTLR